MVPCGSALLRSTPQCIIQVQQAAAVGPTTYSEMVQHVRGRRISQPQDMG